MNIEKTLNHQTTNQHYDANLNVSNIPTPHNFAPLSTSHSSLATRQITNITPTTTENLITQALSEISHKKELAKLSSTFKDVPSDSLEKLLPLLIPCMQSVKNGFLRAQLVEILLLFSPILWTEQNVLKICSSFLFFKEVPTAKRSYFIKCMQAIPQEQRDISLFDDVFYLFKNSHEEKLGWPTFATVVLLDQACFRRDLVSKVVRTIQTLLSSQAQTTNTTAHILLKAVQSIPVDKRSLILEKSLPFLQKSPAGQDIHDILQVMNQLPKELLDPVVEQSLLFLSPDQNFGHASVIKQIASLMQKNRYSFHTLPSWISEGNGYIKSALLKALDKLPQEEAIALVQSAYPVLLKISPNQYDSFLLKTLNKIPKNQRDECVQCILPYASLVRDINELLVFVHSLSKENRDELMASYAPFLAKTMQENLFDGLVILQSSSNKEDLFIRMQSIGNDIRFYKSDLVTFIENTQNIASQDFLENVSKLADLFKQYPNLTHRYELLEAIHLVAKEEQESVIESISLLSSSRELYELVPIIAKIPKSQRKEFAQLTSDLLIGSHYISQNEVQAIWQGYLNTTQEERTQLIGPLRSSFKGSHSNTIAMVFQQLATASPSQRKNVLTYAFPLFVKEKSNLYFTIDAYISIVQSFIDIPQEKIKFFVYLFNSLTEANPHLLNKPELLKDLQEWICEEPLDEEEVTLILETIKPLLAKINSEVSRPDLLRCLFSISKEKRTILIEQISKSFASVTVDNLISFNLFRVALLIPESQREIILKGVLSWNLLSLPLKNAFYSFVKIPPSQQVDILNNITAFISIVAEIEQFALFPYESLNAWILFFALLAPEKRSLALSTISQNKNSFSCPTIRFSLRDSLHTMALFHPTIWVDSHPHLQTILEEVQSNQRLASTWAHLFLHNQESLGIHDEHPLFQHCLEILHAADHQIGQERINPYHIHAHLSHMIDKDPLINTIALYDHHASIEIPLSIWREKTQKKALTGKDLPQGVFSNSFQTLFTSLEKELLRMPALKQEIQQVYLKTVEELKEQILHGEVIPGLLQLPTTPEDPISDATFYLYTILHFILQETTHRETTESLLSPQERMLLNFASLVTSCKTGQLDGISLYYNQLPLEYKIEKKAKISSESALFCAIDVSVQSTMHKVLNSEPLLRTLTKETTVAQQSHQTLYLKNRLHHQLGLRHSLTFDLHGRLIHPRLLSANTSDLVVFFFSFCSYKVLAANLQEELQKSPKLINYALSYITTIQEKQSSLDELFLQKTSSFTESELASPLWECIATLFSKEDSNALISFLIPSLHGQLNKPVSDYRTTLQQQKLAKLLQSNLPIPSDLELLLQKVQQEKRASDLELRRFFQSFPKVTSSEFVQQLEQLSSEELNKSVKNHLECLERKRNNDLCKNYLASLPPMLLSQTLEKHLSTLSENSLPKDTYAALKGLIHSSTLQMHLSRLAKTSPLSPMEASLSTYLQKLPSNKQTLSLRRVLQCYSKDPLHVPFTQYIKSPNSSIASLQKRLTKYPCNEVYADFTLYEIARSLPDPDLPVQEEEVIEWLAHLNPVNLSFYFKRNAQGELIPLISTKGALYLLHQAGYFQCSFPHRKRPLASSEI